MDAFKTHSGIVAVLDRANVDTDQIIPKQFLKRVERTGFGEFLFFDWRYHEDGSVCPGFELNGPMAEGASILVAGKNFGSGSSREHAPWALLDYGFHVIIAQSYADIFFNNCFKNGILPIVLPQSSVLQIMNAASSVNSGKAKFSLTVNLENQTILDGGELNIRFDVDPFRRHCLLNGLDDIGLTLQNAGDINSFEKQRPVYMPVVAS